MNPWMKGLKAWNADTKRVSTATAFAIPRKGTASYSRVMALRGERRSPKENVADMMQRPVLRTRPGNIIYADL